MKKLILFFVLIQYTAVCQIENSVFPALPYTELSEIVVEGDHIYTAGDCNTALISNDGGQNWTTVPIKDRARNVKVLPGTNGEKAIYQFQDEILVLDANTLEFVEISSGSLFLSSGNYVSIETDKENVYVISNQNIHVTAAGGDYTWTKIADFNFDNDAVVATDITDNYIHIGTLNGLLFRVDLASYTVDMRNDFMNRVLAFDMVTDDLGYFTIQNFQFPVKTTDGGVNYSDLENLPENINVTGYGENVVMTINTNRMYVSTDGGQTSTYIPFPDDGTYDLVQSKFVTEDGALYVAGRSSMIAKSEDFGTSFINLNEYKRENLQDIDMHSSGTGVAVGGYSSIVKTEDGGNNWSLRDISFGGDNNYFNAVIVLSKNKYIVAGSNTLGVIENGEVVHTVERGIDVLHYNAAGGYLIGLQSSNSDYTIVKSSDEGMTWESKAFLPGYTSHISQSPSGKLYIPGQEGNVYVSYDGGDTWDIEEFGDGLNIRSVDFLTEDLGIGSTGPQLYLTRDGGTTAELISSGYIIDNLHFISENQIVYTTANEAQTNIYESTDGGESFTENKEFCSQSSRSYRSSDNTIWYAQRGGHINKYKPEGTSSVQSIENLNASLYPNPVAVGQDVTIDTKKSISEIVLTSLSGQVLLRKQPSSSNTISTVGLSSGLYTIAMKSVNGDVQYGKLVIVE